MLRSRNISIPTTWAIHRPWDVAFVSETVSCYSEARYAERPTAFRFDGEELVVAEVLRNWREPDSLNFVVLVPDGRHFQLAYHEQTGRWRVEPLTRRSF